MNCKTIQIQIEESAAANSLTNETRQHLESCADCQTFNAERAALRNIVGTLQTVNAPADFNFRVKSRLRRTEKLPAFSWQKISLISAPALCALLVLTFAFTRNPAPPTENTAAVVPAAPVEKTTVSPTAPPEIVKQTASPAPEFVAVTNSPAPFQRTNAKAKPTAHKQIIKNSDSDDEIRSKDSAVVEGKQITPRGFPNPIEPPKTQDAKGLLQTFGIETEPDAEGLRVTKSNNLNLKIGDTIQKINGENPHSLSGKDLKEIKLTVTRQNETREIKIN